MLLDRIFKCHLLEMRASCLNCVRKHLSQALILMMEVKQGYPQHRWIAIGHMGEAADESIQGYPALAAEIRKHRLAYMKDQNYAVPIMKMIAKASSLAGDRKDIVPGGKGDKLKTKDVNQDELRRGIKVELEHTKSKKIATEIALDHLAEDPKYYSKLKKIHKE